MRRWWWMVIAAITIAGVCAFWVRYVEVANHHEWYHRVHADIVALADKQPPDVSRGQWEFMIWWTLNLHANCAAMPTQVERTDRDQFVEELEQRMHRLVSTTTIDWIWDEYTRISRYGQSYSDRFRPTRSPELKDIRPDSRWLSAWTK